MSVTRTPIPNKARDRAAVPWRLTINKELNGDQLTALGAAFLEGTSYHYLISADVYPGLTQFVGDYFATRGHGKDLSRVAYLWDKVQSQFPELVVDAVLEYRVPSSLLDDAEPLDVVDLTRPGDAQ